MKNTPNAVTSVGMMMAPNVPVQPNCRMRMNSGMMPSWVGMAMVATTNTMSALLPRNRSLANAKPARVEKVTTENVMTPETMTLLSIACQNGMVSNTSATFFQNCPPGSSGGQSCERTEVGLEPTTKDHQSGYAPPTRSAIRMP